MKMSTSIESKIPNWHDLALYLLNVIVDVINISVILPSPDCIQLLTVAVPKV